MQSVADANPENAEAIITSAAGSVQLITKSAGPRAAYDWEYSVDGGKTWADVPSTMQAKTVINRLPVAANVMFRFRILTKSGKTDWSQPTSLLVK